MNADTLRPLVSSLFFSSPSPLLRLSPLFSLSGFDPFTHQHAMYVMPWQNMYVASCHVLFGLGAKLISIFYIGQAQRMRLGKSFQPVYYTPLAPPMRALPTIFSGITVSACIGPQSCLHVTPNSESTSYWGA